MLMPNSMPNPNTIHQLDELETEWSHTMDYLSQCKREYEAEAFTYLNELNHKRILLKENKL